MYTLSKLTILVRGSLAIRNMLGEASVRKSVKYEMKVVVKNDHSKQELSAEGR